MKPLFFGSAKEQLFGIYHPPTGATGRVGQAVLLCYPGVQEYNSYHWAFRRLSGLLARQGFHVLRFDYFGTGDSAGRVEDGTVDTWLANICDASRELLDISAARVLSVVGMRLGAALAFKACCETGLSTKDLVLWNPVVSGRNYLQELSEWDRTTNLSFLHTGRTRGRRFELLGYPCPPEQRRAIEDVDLCESPRPTAQTVHIVVGENRPSFGRLRASLERANVPVTHRVVSDAAAAVQNAGPDRAMLSNEILVAITEELSPKATV